MRVLKAKRRRNVEKTETETKIKLILKIYKG